MAKLDFSKIKNQPKTGGAWKVGKSDQAIKTSTHATQEEAVQAARDLDRDSVQTLRDALTENTKAREAVNKLLADYEAVVKALTEADPKNAELIMRASLMALPEDQHANMIRVLETKLAPKETRSAQVGLRLFPSMLSALERAADDDNRTVANLIEKVLSDWLKANRYLPNG